MNITADEIRKVGWWESWTTSRYYGMDLDGEPIYRDGRIYYCSECGHKSIIKHNYCPYCGRKMEGQLKQQSRPCVQIGRISTANRSAT